VSVLAESARDGEVCTIKNHDCGGIAVVRVVTDAWPEPNAEPVIQHMCLRCGVEYTNAMAFLLSSVGADEVRLRGLAFLKKRKRS
jgi:hypothetical protein